jgi:hypothetical protein
MKIIRRRRTVRLKVCNLTENPLKVAFEPLGDQADLSAGETFAVEISGPGDGLVEICVSENGLIVGEWDGARTRIRNMRGENVKTY